MRIRKWIVSRSGRSGSTESRRREAGTGAGREQDWRWNTLRPADLFPGWLTRSPGGFAFVSPVGVQQAKIPVPQSAMEG